jgi:SAM-dependent methyltransferase
MNMPESAPRLSPPLSSFAELGASYDRSRWLDEAVLAALLTHALDTGGSGLPMPQSILDLGCGTGQVMRLLGALSPADIAVVGMDIALPPLHVARDRAAASRLICGDAARPPLRPRSFDAVVICHLVEHIPGWMRAGRAWLDLLRAGGRLLLLATPGFMRTGPRSRMRELLDERGLLPGRRGATGPAEVADWFAGQGAVVHKHEDSDWTWLRTPNIGASLNELQARSHSRFWDVPPSDYDAAFAQVTREYASRVDQDEVIHARAFYYEVCRE